MRVHDGPMLGLVLSTGTRSLTSNEHLIAWNVIRLNIEEHKHNIFLHTFIHRLILEKERAMLQFKYCLYENFMYTVSPSAPLFNCPPQMRQSLWETDQVPQSRQLAITKLPINEQI